MSVCFDENLSLFQLAEFPDPGEMFDENYAFFSGTSKYMASHFKNFSHQIKEKGQALKIEYQLKKFSKDKKEYFLSNPNELRDFIDVFIAE